jgi:hypothetical protein
MNEGKRGGRADIQAAVPNTLMVTPREDPGVVISETHYKRIQKRIREGVGDATSSIWLALALAALGIGVTLVVTVISTDMDAETKGKTEVAAWASLALTVAFVVFHFAQRRTKKNLAEDICDDMDTHCRVQREAP